MVAPINNQDIAIVGGIGMNDRHQKVTNDKVFYFNTEQETLEMRDVKWMNKKDGLVKLRHTDFNSNLGPP